MNGTTDMAVSNQWKSRPYDQRFTTLNDLYAFVQHNHAISRELPAIEGRDMSVCMNANYDDLVIDVKGESYEMTHYSFGQLCQRAKAPAAYLRNGLPMSLSAECLNHSLRNAEDPMMPYVMKNGRSEVRALTSPTYGRIYDKDVVDAVMVMNDSDGGRWKVPGVLNWGTGKHNPHVDVTKENTTLYASDRDLFVFLCDDLHPVKVGTLPNGDDDLLFRGFYVQNSEVGNASFSLTTMYMRAVCQNRILWGVEQRQELVFRHSSGAPEKFMREALPSLRSFSCHNSQLLLDGVNAAKRPTLPSARPEKLQWIANNTGLTLQRSASVLELVELEENRYAESVWDVAQGITALARRIPYQDQRIELERTAKRLLDKVTA